MMLQSKPFQYGKNEANYIKGIAILMMLIHHLFGFPVWLEERNMYMTFITYHDVTPALVIGLFCKLCVGLFAFSTGYAMYIQEEKYLKYKYILKRAGSFLVQYWVIFAIFIVIGVLIREPLPSVKRLIAQLFGIATATGFDWKYHSTIHPIFAWYVSFYLIFLFTFPIIRKFLNRGFWITNITFFLLFNGTYVLLTYYIWPGMPGVVFSMLNRFALWGNIGWIGYLFARHDAFTWIDTRIKRILRGLPLVIVCIVVLLVMVLMRYAIGATLFPHTVISLDVVYTPVLIYIFITILHYFDSKKIYAFLKLMAVHSLNIWFLQAIFFTPYNKLQWLAYWGRVPVVILIWSTILLLVFSIGVEKLKGGVKLAVTRARGAKSTDK